MVNQKRVTLTLRFLAALGSVCILVFAIDNHWQRDLVATGIGLMLCVVVWALAVVIDLLSEIYAHMNDLGVKLMHRMVMPQQAQAKLKRQQEQFAPELPQSNTGYYAPPRSGSTESPKPDQQIEDLDYQLRSLFKYLEGTETPAERDERRKRWSENLYERDAKRARRS